ncbi:MAG TPA: hypothetical protein VGL63_12820 [Streptosporangiaceae bacterium]|jgi:thiamine kinase-like enzyme
MPRVAPRIPCPVGCADLPQAFAHPDFVPANAIETPEGDLMIVDWTGAGRGPQVFYSGNLSPSRGAS